ncbi:MAG: alpha/beta fold hydrolase [Symploca sp. SIO2C1]|nr:alpha/beta fold hydrolase [Symploca sp. SIO2C1]
MDKIGSATVRSNQAAPIVKQKVVESTPDTFSDRNPVLLIHGITDTKAVFRKMSTYLEGLGWSVHSLNLIPNNATVGLDQLAQQVADYIAKHFDPKQPLDLVGFSMGGLVSRYYIQRLGGIERVQRYVNISAPNNGTLTAYLLSRLGCVQMRPESEFLQDINRDSQMLESLKFTRLWTPFDLMIVPATSSQMPVGKEVKIPVLIHAWMLKDQRCLKAVAAALSEPISVACQSRNDG